MNEDTPRAPTSSSKTDVLATAKKRLNRIHRALLFLTLAVALFLRAYNVDWADGQLPHPDERSTIAFYAPTIHMPKSLDEFLDPKKSPLNPLWDVNAQRRRSYTYGHFPLYLLVFTANVAAKTAPLFEALGASPETVSYIARLNGVPGFAIVGRLLMALSDTFTVFLVYLIARRLYGKWWGLLAATLTTFTVTHIQLAHFFAVDPMSTTFTMLAIYGAMRMAEEGRPRDAVLTGVGIALAVGSKFSALPIVAAPVIAVVVKSSLEIRDWRLEIGESRISNLQSPISNLQLLLLSLITAAIVFALTSPYVILDWPNFKQAVIVEQGAMVRGDADFPFTRQYRGTTPYLYHIEQSVRWGMGWALGIVGWLGLAWAFWRALRRRLQPGEWMLLAWVVLYFGPTGLFLAKFMRYTLPIVPALIIFGTGLLKAISDTRYPIPDTLLGYRVSGIRHWLSGVLVVGVLAHAIFWSLAFVHGVYGHIHTWITASRWIYANVPDGAVLATEHWDDRLPLGLPEPNANPGRYQYVTMPMYEEDTPEKYEIIKNNLRQADYYVFATARLYRTIPRLPERYPMTTRFYQLFFAEKLGFVRVLDVTSYPRLGPFVFPDDEADESFWVYDHPRVLVYKKVRDLTDEEWDALLGGTWEGAKHWYVPKTLLQRMFEKLPFGGKQPAPAAPPAPEERKGPSLLMDMTFDEMPVVRFWRWNRWASEHTVPAVVLWWLALLVVGLAAWPLTYLVFAHLHDRGYAFSKGLGLLVVAYLAWIVPSLRLWTNDLPLVLTVLLFVLLVNAWIARRFREPFVGFVRARWRLLLFYEALFAVAYLFFVFIRLLNPDLWQPWNGGEKFMEIAYLNATVRSPYFPPYDPYFAGGTINYYYWGYQIVNVLIKLTGITPTVAFNLAVPTFFALTVVAACGLVVNMVEATHASPLRFGIIGAAFVALFGNLDGAFQIFRNLANVSGSDFRSIFPWLQTAVRAAQGFLKVWNGQADLPKYDYWAPSRVIPFTINEFPYWSFLFADLHPHMINIPFAILFLGLALNVLLAARRSWFEGRDDRPAPVELGRMAAYGVAQFAVLPFALGALAVINTWDLPTYLGIIAVALFLRQWRSKPRVNWLLWLAQVGVILAGAYLLYRPFFAHYAPTAASGVGWAPQKTSLGVWLNIWGLWFFLALTFLAVELTRRDRWPVARVLRGVVVYYERLPRYLRLVASYRLKATGYRLQVTGLKLNVRRGMGLVDTALQPVGSTFNLQPLTFNLKLAFLSPSLLAVVLWLAGYRVPAVLIVPIVLFAVLTLRKSAPLGVTFATLMAFTGLLILFGVEFVYLKDHLQGGDFKRMNTLFKFYIQAWILLTLADAVGLSVIWQRLPEWRPWVRAAWQTTFALLVAFSLTFLVVGTPARVDDRFPKGLSERPPFGTLDGMAYMKYGVYTWPNPQNRIELKWDYEAIRWLLDNVEKVEPIAEARLDYYREGGTRVASFTGLPTFMGLHQMGEQRYGWQTGPRQQLALEFWQTADINRTMDIIRQVGIRYIYVGQLERQQYPPDAIAKFDRMVEMGLLEVVYENPGVTIYRVK